MEETVSSNFDDENLEISTNQTGQGTKGTSRNSKVIQTTSLPHQKISFNTTETKDSNVINISNHTESYAKSPVSSLDHGDEKNLSLGPKIGDEDRETSCVSSNFDDDNLEISTNQTGQGTKGTSRNSKVIQTTSLPHQKISFNTTETKDSNVINISNHTESCAKSPVSSLDHGNEVNLSSGPKIGNEDPETSSVSSNFDDDNLEISKNQTGQGTKGKDRNSKVIQTTS